MTNVNPTRLGQVNNAGDVKATFLKVFSGEVLSAYDENNVSDDLHFQRTIENGKSASFPVTWKVDSGYHTAGTPLLGSQKMNKNEMIISIDDLLVSDVFIANIDEAMSHVDFRQIYSKQIGAALARAKDKRIFQTALLAARSPAFVTGKPGGSSLYATAAARTDALLLAAAISQAGVLMDEKDIPAADRYGIFRPAQTHLMATASNMIHKDLGGDGNISTGYIGSYDNVKIMKSNNVPSAVVGAAAGDANTYGGNFTNTIGLIMNREAVGTVKLMDVSVEMTGNDFNIQYQGTLVVGKYLQGHGILRPECAVEIATAAI